LVPLPIRRKPHYNALDGVYAPPPAGEHARRPAWRVSGGLGDERHAEWALLARLPQDLFGKIGAAAASAGATGGAGQIIQGPGAFGRGPADHVFGNGIADANVHGSSAKGCLIRI